MRRSPCRPSSWHEGENASAPAAASEPGRRRRSSPEQTRQLSPAAIRRGTVSVSARNDRVDEGGGGGVERPGPPPLRGDDVPRRADAARDVTARGPPEPVQQRRRTGL